MDLIVYGVLCRPERMRECAYRLLALALRREYGLEPLPKIAQKPRGKPFFPGFPHIHFNLSHSRGAAVCALHNLPVGIDVERLRPAPKRLSAGMEDEAFFRLWTAKEATIKREGKGIEALLRPLEPDPLCQCLEGFLPGWIVTVCPTEPGPLRMVRTELETNFASSL